MPRKKPHNPLRVILPLALLFAGGALALTFMLSPGPSKTGPDDKKTETGHADEPDAAGAGSNEPRQPTDQPEEGPTDPAETDQSGADEPSADQPGGDAPAADPDAPIELVGLHAQVVPDPGGDADWWDRYEPLGGIDPSGDDNLQIAFSRYGAGVASLQLADYFDASTSPDHVELQSEYDYENAGVTPFSADRVLINGSEVLLQGVPDDAGIEQRLWEQLPVNDPAERTFRATVVNADAEPVLEITRTYRLEPGAHEFTIAQRLVNLTDRPLEIAYRQYGPVELPQITVYPSDRRRLRFGTIRAGEVGRGIVKGDTALKMHDSALKPKVKGSSPTRYEPLSEIWPTERAIEQEQILSWIAHTNRYFSVAVLPASTGSPALEGAATVERFVLNRENVSGGLGAVLGLRLTSGEITLAPGGSRSLDLAVFAGPKNESVIADQPLASAVNLSEVVVYNFGGWCAACTFSWLTGPLLMLLRFLHDYLVFDWALAVIVLVIIVRSILHPITKWSQIRMQRFAKQMQEVAPKQKKLQERYKDDPQRLRTEMARLWREEGVSPAGMLGCLPMFLQSPVWIALYAVLFYAIDLRQDPAFFGVFQQLFNGWAFLGDLSRPDRAIFFGGDGFRIPLISALLGPINSFNILPLLLGFVFFVHQKYLTPPTSATMTPEQRQQQKIIRVMSVVLFPVIMYNAPSGLALYFVANSAFAIVENKWIRAHMDKHGLLDLDRLKEQRKKKPTFMQRLQQRAQQIQEQRQLYQAGGGKGDPRNQPRKKAAPPAPDRFKKRK